MDTDSPFEALKRCEEELRRLAAKAASRGDYDLLARLTTAARAVSEIARGWEPDSRAASTSVREAETAVVAPSGLESGSVHGRRIRSAAGSGYPRFVRRGDELVKVGWSRGERKEYQHRAHHSLLVALQRALLDASRRRRLFTMDSLAPQLAATGMPGYQAYVWLAWLRAAGLVKQHGRRGYSVLKPATFEADVQKVFAEVPVQEL